MVAIDSDKLASALVHKLGCAQEISGDHIRFVVRDRDGTTLARTRISHGPKHVIDDYLLTQMARQRRLGTAKNLVAFVRCNIERQEALRIIRESQ